MEPQESGTINKSQTNKHLVVKIITVRITLTATFFKNRAGTEMKISCHVFGNIR